MSGTRALLGQNRSYYLGRGDILNSYDSFKFESLMVRIDTKLFWI